MKKTIIVILTLLILLISLSTVSAEENTTNDTNNLTDLELIETNLTENSTHNHTEASSIMDGPVKATVRYATGGTFANFQTVINGASAGDIIEVQGDYYQASTSRININKALTINGNGHTFDAQNKSTIFYVTKNSVFNDITFINGKVTGNGANGAVYVSGTSIGAEFYNCIFYNNSRIGSMGGSARGVALAASSFNYLEVHNCQFYDNFMNSTYTSNTWNGAILYTLNGNWVNITDSTFVNNTIYSYNRAYTTVVSLYLLDTYESYVEGCYFVDNYGYQSGFYGDYESIDLDIQAWSRTNIFASVTNSIFISKIAPIGLSDWYNSGSTRIRRNLTTFFENNWFGSNAPETLISNNLIDNWLVVKFINTSSLNSGSTSLQTSFYIYNRTSNTLTPSTVTLSHPRMVNFTTSSGSVSPKSSTLTGTNTINGVFNSAGAGSSVSAHVDNQVLTLTYNTGNFAELQSLIDATPVNGVLTLDKNYKFNTATDLLYYQGMFINKTITIEGNGYTIDGSESDTGTRARIFNITADDVKLNNLNLINSYIYYWYSDTYNVEDTWGAAILLTGNNTIITNSNFTNNGYPSLGFEARGYVSVYHGGAIHAENVVLTLKGCNFINNSANDFGGAIYTTDAIMYIYNCSFINNTAETNGGGAICIDYTDYYVYNSSFIDNRGYNYGAAIWNDHPGAYVVNNCVFVDDLTVGTGREVYSNGDNNFEYNWWGTNEPNFASLCYGFTPETWVIMNFTNLDKINSTNFNKNITLLASLNNLYNDTTGEYTIISGLPERTVIYEATDGYYSHNESGISGEDYVNFTYPSGLTSLTLNATIDNQVLTIETADIEVTVSVDLDTPVILQTITYTVRVDNNGPDNARDVRIYFKPPTQFIYQSDDSGGTYNITTGEWYIGDMANGDFYELNIEVMLPYNKSLENKTINSTATVNGIYADLNNDNDNSTVNITILEKTGGSYLDLQYLIDITPSGGTLVMDFNVTYNDTYDYSLIRGMNLDKPITIIGNGYTISGNQEARIFNISSDNITLKGIRFVNGSVNNALGNRGGAVYSYNCDNLTVINCTFIDNWARQVGAGVCQDSSTSTGNAYVYNSTFINNGESTSSSYHGDGTVWITGFGVVEGCLFDGDYAWGCAAVDIHDGRVNNNVFVNTYYTNYATWGGVVYTDYADFNDNWWGTNEPNFNILAYSGTPTITRWIVMNFTNTTPIFSSAGGSATFKVSLDTVYNDTDGSYAPLNGYLPTRTVIYNSTDGYYSHNESNISGADYVNFNYPAGLTGILVNATIDDQVLTIGTADIEVNLTVDLDTPVIMQIITYTIKVTNNGPYIAKNVTVHFEIPSCFVYQSDDSGGYYNDTTGEWYIGDMEDGDYYELNVDVRIPYNKSLENKTIYATANVTGDFPDLNPEDNNATVNITILEKNGGSYLDLQYLIDITPSGGTLVMGFNVTYNDTYDYSLIRGMNLDKPITIIGNGYTISGNQQARIFNITSDDINLKGIRFVNASVNNALGNFGGAIHSYDCYNLTVINCTFIDNWARKAGAAICQHSSSTIGSVFVYNSTFIDNGENMGASYKGEGTLFANGYAVVEGCLFDGDYSWGCAAVDVDYGIVNRNVFVNSYYTDYATWGGVVYMADGNADDNWWGTNDPNFGVLIHLGSGTLERWVVMNFTNTTPVDYPVNGTSNLLVTLDTVYNDTDGQYYPLNGYLPTRTVTFDWTHGNVTPNTTNITNSVSVNFNYLEYPNMPAWMINATIDDQTLSIGSSDIAIDITPNYDPIDDGENISYTVTVVNNGPFNSTDINATLYLPLLGLLNITVIANDGVYNNTTGVWEIGFLDVGDFVTLEINGTLADPGPFLIWNATVNFGSRYDYNHTNNTFISNVTVNQIADLEIHKNLTQNTTPQTKDNITYTIVVFNNGPSTAVNVTVFDNLSSKLIYINSSATNGYYNETEGIWYIDNITPYSNETLNITVIVNNSGFINNYVNVTSNITDNNLTNNFDNVSFETPPMSDLWVTITMEPQSSNYITYHIQAGNNGIEDANGTIVVFNLSNLYIWFNHTTDKGVYNNDTGVWDIGYLEVNETVNMTLIVRLDFPTGITFANITTSVNIDSWSTDLYPENNTDNVTFEAEIFGNFRLLQDIVDSWAENTTQILPRSFAYDPVQDAILPGETYDLVNGVRLYKNVTIVNPHGFTLGGFDMARIFNISANNVILDGLKFYDGNSPLGGALNIHADNVQVLRSNFTHNRLFGDYGGAIFTNGKNTLIRDNYFVENYVSKLGGAIGAVKATNLQIINNTFINNTVESDEIFGGAVGIANSTATINNNVFLDNQAINAPNLGSAIYTYNSNVNLEANWFGNNTPNMTNDKLIWGVKPETYVILDWEISNPTMTGVTLNAVFVLYNTTNGNKTPIGSGLPYRTVNITARNPTLSWYNKTFTGNNTVNYTYNVAIPVYQVNATVDYQTITLEWSTFLDAYKSLVNDTIWFGDDLIYIINLTNYGPHDSYIITISDLLPENLTINNVTPAFGSTSIMADNVYWTLVLNAGDNATLIVNTTPTTEAIYTNNLTVNSTSQYDYFLHGNISVTGEVLPLIDLSINLTISNPPYYVGEEINYTITIHNNGPSNATDVWVYIPIPTGLKFLYAWNLDGYIPNYNNITGWWNVSTLNAGETIQINMTLQLNKSGEYNQTVNITGYGVELNDTDNNMTVYFNVTTQVDLELNMTISVSETLYGKLVSITYSLINKGPSPATNTTVFTVFSGLTYSSSTGYGSFSNITPFTGYWYVGNLNKDKLVTRTVYFYANTLGNITVTGKANCSDNESYWPDNYDNVTLKVIKYADISITKTVSNKTPFLEQTITYTIIVTNNAGFDAENVTVYDPLPSVLVYDNSTLGYNGTEWFVGNLTVGQSKNITFNVTVDGIGIIWNNATVNSSLNDSNYNNNHAEVDISVPVADDLRMFIDVIPNPPTSGNSFIINLSVWNRGFTDNQNVTVEFHIPSSLTYLNSTNMGAYNPLTGFWDIGFLGNGSRVDLLIWVSPNTVGNITLTANVSGQVADVAPWNNRANITFELLPAFDLTVTKTANTTLVDDGDIISFDINVWNNGPYAASNVKIIDYLPNGVEYLINNASGVYDNITHTVNWTIPSLAVGDNITFHLTCRVWNPGFSFTNIVNASVYGTDNNLTDNIATCTVNVTPVNDLEVKINASKLIDIDLGDIVVFTITVINHGPSNATGVIANFTIPSIFSYINDTSGGYYLPSTGEWLIGNLESGNTTTLYVTTNLTSMGVCTPNVTVNSTYTDKNLSNNYDEINLTATSFFDLNITAYWNLTNNTVVWQNLANLTIIISNNGPENATDVKVNINVPGVSYVNDTSFGNLNTTTWIWTIGNLSVGEYKNITITFKGEDCGFYWTTGNITGHGHDTNITDNNYTLNLSIIPVVDLVMTNLTVNTTFAGLDDILEFNVTVYNKGPCNATNTTIVGLLPSGWYIYGGSTVADIPVNTSHTFNILVNASTYGNFTVGFNATINGIDTYPLDNHKFIGPIEIIYHADLMITIKASNQHPATGDIVVYVITVTNLDWRTAHNVTANITIPDNLTFDHYYLASGSYNVSNGTWTIGNLSFRNSTSLFLFARVNSHGETNFWVNVTGDDYDFHLENNNDTCLINTTLGLDLNITINTLNTTPYTGDNLTFTVNVENNGLINASGVSVDINIPSGFINPTSDDLNFTGSSWYIGNLNIGEVKTLNFTVIPITNTNLTILTSVSANRYDYNSSNNFANITVSPLVAGDLEVNITSNNSHPMVGENVTYTITVLNKGMTNANNVIIFNNLPYSLAYSTSTPIYSPSLKMWSITSLAPNTIETLNITINHTNTGIFNYTVNITGNLIDLNTTNNIDNITTTVDDYNDLYVEFTVSNNTILDNNLLNFTITVYNNGSFNNTNVIVYTNLPNTDIYNCTGVFDTNIGIWEVGNLQAGENKTLTLTINMTNVGNYTYWVNTSGKQKDRNYSNNNQSLNLTILADYDLQINITLLTNNTLNVGENITFQVTVFNNGPSTAHNVTILHDLLGTPYTISIGNLTNNEIKYYNITINLTNNCTFIYNVEVSSDNIIYDRNITNNKDNITITVFNAVDLIIKVTSNVTSASKFDIAEILVNVYNNVSNTAHNVLINTSGLFDSNVITNSVNNGFIVGTDQWLIPTLVGYGNATLILTKILVNKTWILVNVSSSDLELDNSTNNDTLFINVTGLSDLKVNITVDNNTPSLMDNITFTITVYNLGEDTAEDVKIYLDLPYSTIYSDVYMYDSIQGIWNVGTLANGTNRTLNVTVTLSSTGVVTYHAYVNASTPDNYTNNNYDNVTLNITSLTDLEVQITTNITGDVLYAGDIITFTITVINHGPSTATDINITYNLPGTVSTYSIGSIIYPGLWNIPNLNSNTNTSLKLTYTLSVGDDGTYYANATGLEKEKNTTNNNATINISLNKTSDLKIAIKSNTTILDMAELILYTVTVTNMGPDTLNNANVSFDIPNDFNITFNMSSNGIFNGSNWIIGSLGTGGSGIATLYFEGYYTGFGNKTINVKVNSTQIDRNLTNNNDNVTVYLIPACDLSVNFTSNGFFNPDGTMAFNITVTNYGPSNATNITVNTNLSESDDYNATSGYFDTLQDIWYIDSLNVGETQTLIINTTLKNTILFYANIISPIKELNTSNNIKWLNITTPQLADLSINITMNNTSPVLGETVMFTITANNLGPYTATDVIVYVDLPASPVYTISKGLFSTVTGNWSIGNLNVGENATLNITLNITSMGTFEYHTNITGSTNDTNISNNNDTINFTVAPTTDLAINLTVNQTNFTVGDNVTFTIIIFNNGPSNATNFTITLNSPTGFNIDPFTVPIGTYTSNVWNIPNFENNTKYELSITGILTLNGTNTFKTNITSETYDNDTNNNIAILNLDVENLVDLEIHISTNTTSILAGEYVNIYINVTNYGPGLAKEVLISSNIFNATSFKDDGYYDKETGYWYIGTLNTNTTAYLNLTLRITDNTTFDVSVNTINMDNNTLNNNDTCNITVSPLTDLNLTVTISDNNLYLEDAITYTITVVNNGFSIAFDVNLTSNLTNTSDFIFIYSNDTNYNPNSGVWTIGNINPNETRILKVKYMVNVSGNITNSFYVNTTTYELNLINNNANVTIFVNNSTKPITDLVDLIVNITVNNSTPNLYDLITFNITVYNNASITASNVTIENFLPNGLTPVGVYTGNWSIGSLGAYANGSFTFTVNVTGYGSFVSNVTANSNNWDANPTDNRANVLVVLEGNSTDYADLEINVTRYDNLTVGENFTYNITVTNNGPSDAINVEALISLFAGLEVLNYTCNGTYNATDCLWKIGNITPGSSETLELTINLTNYGYYNNAFLVYSSSMDSKPENNLVLDNFEVNDTRVDISIRISANKTFVGKNESINFTVTVINHLNPASEVNITLNIPNEFIITNFTGNDTNSSYYIGNMTTGQTTTFNFIAILNSTNASTITVNATLNETDSYDTDNIDTIIISPLGADANGVADLHINITVNEQYPEIETVPIFTIWVTNFGPDNATNVVIPVYVPENCTNTAFYANASGVIWNTSTNTITIPQVSVGEIVYTNIYYCINTTVPIIFNVSASSDQFDPNITDNKASISLYPWEATPTCDLNITIVPMGSDFHAGDIVKFNVTIRNYGEKTAHNVTVSSIVPSGLTLINITSSSPFVQTSDGWFIFNVTKTISEASAKSFIVAYNITNKGLYHTTMEVNTSTVDVDPTSNGMGVAIYAGELDSRIKIPTNLTNPAFSGSTTLNASKGDLLKFKSRLTALNDTTNTMKNFAGQSLSANITSADGSFSITVDSIDLTVGTNGYANFAVNSSLLLPGITKYNITVFYKGNSTSDYVYLPTVSNKVQRQLNIKT